MRLSTATLFVVATICTLWLAFVPTLTTRVAANGKGHLAITRSKWMTVHPTADMCSLAELYVSGGTRLSPPFHFGQFDYSCSCPSNTNAVRVTATLGDDQNANLELLIDGHVFQTLVSGVPSNEFLLHSGTNLIQVRSVCDDCKRLYTMRCGRPGGNPPPNTGTSTAPPLPPPGVIGDPTFTGLRGQVFQVHGVANEVYNIISTPHVQMNSRFVFLDQGECAVLPSGERQTSGCFTHPGSYLGEVALKTSVGDRVLIRSGTSMQGFASVTVNERDLLDGEMSELRTVDAYYTGWVARNDSHTVTLEMSRMRVTVTNSDLFVNQHVHVDALSEIQHQLVHGLLGQTWDPKTVRARHHASGAPQGHIEGSVDDYRLPDQDLWSDDFVFNRFGHE